MRRLRLGRDAEVLVEDGDGVELESAARLAPGRHVEIVRAQGARASVVSAVVESWRVTQFSRAGPIYRGYCRWLVESHGGADGR